MGAVCGEGAAWKPLCLGALGGLGRATLAGELVPDMKKPAGSPAAGFFMASWCAWMGREDVRNGVSSEISVDYSTT